MPDEMEEMTAGELAEEVAEANAAEITGDADRFTEILEAVNALADIVTELAGKVEAIGAGMPELLADSGSVTAGSGDELDGEGGRDTESLGEPEYDPFDLDGLDLL